MLSVRGTYTGKIVKPLAKIKKRPNTPVIITFLDHDEDVLTQVAIARSKYQERAESFDFGATPGEDYAQEIMPEYFSTFSRI
jgi:hypothetical protein